MNAGTLAIILGVVLLVILIVVGLLLAFARKGEGGEGTKPEQEEQDINTVADNFWSNWKPQQDPAGHDQW